MLYLQPRDNTHKNRDDRADLRTRHVPRGRAISMALIAWIAVVAGGIGILGRYEHAAGLVQPSPVHWPADSAIPASKSRSKLLMFAHPKCPCTRASVGELARIMTACSDNVQAYAIFVKPSGSSSADNWEKTDLWHSAEEIPGVTVIVDIDGVEAKRFRAATSGFVVLYDHTGQLQFSGGITASRGHSGDNLGRSAIVAHLTQGTVDIVNTKVYGCELGTNFSGPEQSCCQQ